MLATVQHYLLCSPAAVDSPIHPTIKPASQPVMQALLAVPAADDTVPLQSPHQLAPLHTPFHHTPPQAPSMQWNEGHTWTLDVQLPVGAVNFKIVMHDEQHSNVRWEQGTDRSVLIPETTTVTGAPVGQVRLLLVTHCCKAVCVSASA